MIAFALWRQTITLTQLSPRNQVFLFGVKKELSGLFQREVPGKAVISGHEMLSRFWRDSNHLLSRRFLSPGLLTGSAPNSVQ